MANGNLVNIIRTAADNSPSFGASWICQSFQTLAEYVDAYHPNRWMINYRNDSPSSFGGMFTDTSNDMYPLTVASQIPIKIEIGKYMIAADLEYSLCVENGKQMVMRDGPGTPSLNVEAMEIPKIWEYLSAKLLPGNYVRFSESNAYEDWPYFQFKTSFINPEDNQENVIHTPLHVELLIYEKEYIERESDRMFLPYCAEISYDSKTNRSFFWTEMSPQDIYMGKHKEFEEMCKSLVISE